MINQDPSFIQDLNSESDQLFGVKVLDTEDDGAKVKDITIKQKVTTFKSFLRMPMGRLRLREVRKASM